MNKRALSGGHRMSCRARCAACCIVPSISSSIPGMPGGKPAGVACVQLDRDDLTCRIWGEADYPAVCRLFTPKPDNCGTNRLEAMALLSAAERLTRPEQAPLNRTASDGEWND